MRRSRLRLSLVIFGLLLQTVLCAQLPPADTLPAFTAIDSLPPSSPADTLPPTFSGSTATYTISQDSLTAPVDYAAQDSMSVDFEKQEIHLYGAASVNYESIQLKANHIVLNYGTNIVYAEPLPDSLGQPAGAPEFSDGGQRFVAKEMRYNFKTRKGIVYGTTTTQDDVYVRGGKSKFVSGAIRIDDTTRADVIYTEGAIFTTCTAEHPHFGIRTRKAKVVPNRLAIIGPSNLEIMGVPTPLWLPFGFFPLKSGRSTGLLFPADYTFSPELGFGLNEVGWFFPIGEYVNLQLTTDLYLKGSYAINTNVRYNRRYKYNGNFNFSYRNLRTENRTTLEAGRDRGISLNWSHRQDQRAHPTFTFGGNINFQTNLIDQRFINNFDVVSQNTIRSAMNATKNFPKLKSTLTFGLNHNQNNRNREITVNFPDANFTTQTIYPFRNLPGRQRAWWKKLQFRYNSALRTAFTGADSTFFSQATLDNGQYGFQHQINAGVSLNVLKYFNVSPNVSFAETYYGKQRIFALDGNVQTREIIDEQGNLTIDTTSLGSIINELRPGFASFRTLNAGVNISTQLFGKIRFKRKGFLGLQGLRHVIKPSLNIGYSPDYRTAEDYLSGTRYFQPEEEIDPLNGSPDRFLSPFANQIFGAPPSSKRNLGLNYSIANLFEAKVWSRKDTTSKNIPLFQNISVSGSYDFTDTLQWTPIRIGGGTRLFQGLTQVNLNATVDPYITRYDPVTDRFNRVNVTNLAAGRGLVSLTNFTGTISTNLTVQKIRQIFQGAEEEVVTDLAEARRQRREKENTLFEETDLLSLFEQFSIRHNFNFGFQREFDRENPDVEDRGKAVFIQRANSIELRGSIQLTNNWSVDIGQIGYDFTSQRVTYPFLSFVRDLHCWEMRFSWAPQRNAYNFSIAVKPGTLDFINVPVNQTQFDQGRLFAN